MLSARSACIAATMVAALGCGSSEKVASDSPQPSASVTTEGLKRVPFTKTLIDENQLAESDVQQLQFYLHGKVVLRREFTAEAREVTKEHTLKMVDGQAFDELLVEAGTPGALIPSPAPDTLHVNFDPEEPDAGLEFELTPDNRYRLRGEPIDRVHDRTRITTYGGATFKLVEGAGSFLEISAEDLRALVKRQRKLPGTLLPIEGSSAPPEASAGPPGPTSPPPPAPPP